MADISRHQAQSFYQTQRNLKNEYAPGPDTRSVQSEIRQQICFATVFNISCLGWSP